MPKYEIIHKAGEPVTDEIRWILDRFFDLKEVKKLERLGGRILISIAAPYKAKKSKEITIDESFVNNLKSNRNDVAALRNILDGLTVKLLKEICGLIKQPVRSNATSEEIKRELVRSLQAEDFW
ncbi:hypothetical protein KA005_84490, partial [bacterium]|nr:hypothetical protein [bacterium]